MNHKTNRGPPFNPHVYTLFVLGKIYIECTFQNDLLCVIVTVFNIVQYRTTVLITTLQSALVLSCVFIYLLRQKHFNWFSRA